MDTVKGSETGEDTDKGGKEQGSVPELSTPFMKSLPNGDIDSSSDESSSDESDTDVENRISSNSKSFVEEESKADLKTDLSSSRKSPNRDSDDEHNTSAEMEENNGCVKTDTGHETNTNKSSSPSSTEGVRENCTPDIPTHVPSPLPVLPESGSECVSDSISDDVPSLTRQIPTPQTDSLDCTPTVDCPAVEDGAIKSSRPPTPLFMNSPSTQCANSEQETHASLTDDQITSAKVDTESTADMQALSGSLEQDTNEILEKCDNTTVENKDSDKDDTDALLLDRSELASSSIVAEMEHEDMENEIDDCDEIDNNSMGDIPSDDNLHDFNSDTSTQEALRATENLEHVIATEFENSLEQTEENVATTLTSEQVVQREENMSIENIASVASVGSVHSVHSVNVPSVEQPVQQLEHPNPSPCHPHQSPHTANMVSPHHPSPHQPGPSPHLPSPHHTVSPHHTLSPHHNLSPQCNQISGQHIFSPNPQMNTMTNTSMANTTNTRFNSELDVSQLAGLESPTSISSNEMQNTSSDGTVPQQTQQPTPQPPPSHRRQQQQQQQQQLHIAPNTFSDCAQQQLPFCGNIQFSNNQVPVTYNCSFMDTVNPAVFNTATTYMPIATNPTPMNFMPAATPNSFPNNFAQVIFQQQQQQQQQPNTSQRLTHSATPCPPNVRQGAPANFGGQNSCSLAKLQQLTQSMEIPENQMTPPPTLTPPPRTMTTPSSMMMMPTPTVSSQQSMQQYQRPFQRQKSNSGSSNKKSSNTNITVNPNVAFTPNVTIQPGSNMIPRYNMLEGYRMPQQMINPGYITNTGFINPLRQSNLSMQMGLNMNPINPMNPMNAMNPQQHFQQHMQPPQSNNMYTYHGYINGTGLQNTLNMRR